MGNFSSSVQPQQQPQQLEQTNPGLVSPLTVDNMYVGYINLEHRKDRKAEMERELQKVGWLEASHRQGATKHPVHAYFGVPDSHIACLQKGLASGKPYICVFEDDFDFFIEPNELAQALAELVNWRFDVFLLDSGHGGSHKTATTHPWFHRVTKSISTAGYLVNAQYAPALIQNMKAGKHLIQLFPDRVIEFCIDRYWSQLQSRDLWLAYYKRVGGQRASFSDIEQHVTDYNNKS